MQITSTFPRHDDTKHTLLARSIAYLYLIQKSASGRTEPSCRKDVGRSTTKTKEKLPKPENFIQGLLNLPFNMRKNYQALADSLGS